MTTPTQDQAFQRWDALPDNLREAICFEANSDFVWKVCTDENLSEEKKHVVSRVVGYVFLGFLHPEDIAQELKDRLDLDTKTANTIEDALNKRIFVPLRADIDKIYSPLNKFEARPAVAAPVATVTAPLPKSVATIAPTVQPATLPTVGWSRMSTPVQGIRPPQQTVAPMTMPVQAPQRPIQSMPQPQPQMSPRPATVIPMPAQTLPSMRPYPTPPTSRPMAPSVPSTPIPTTKPMPAADVGPMMLHEDTTFRAAQGNTSFTLSRPGSGADMHINRIAPQSTPVRPAVLEFGGVKPPAPKPSSPSFNPPLAGAATDRSGPRNVSRVFSPVPQPPHPPVPAPAPSPFNAIPVPRPPRPPQPMAQPPEPPQPPKPGNKPIVKNFL